MGGASEKSVGWGPRKVHGPAGGSETFSQPRSAESIGEETTIPPIVEQRTQGSGLPFHGLLLPQHQTVLFGGW